MVWAGPPTLTGAWTVPWRVDVPVAWVVAEVAAGALVAAEVGLEDVSLVPPTAVRTSLALAAPTAETVVEWPGFEIAAIPAKPAAAATPARPVEMVKARSRRRLRSRSAGVNAVRGVGSIGLVGAVRVFMPRVSRNRPFGTITAPGGRSP